MKLERMLLPVALAAAAILVVVLGLRVKRLEGENEELYRRISRAYPGMYVPGFSAATNRGGDVAIGNVARGRQVLFLFNSTCPYCRASIQAWSKVAAEVEAANGAGAAIGVSLDPPDSARAYAVRHQLSYPVASFPDRRMAALYKARSVPVTMVVDSTGRVVLARVGELKDGPAMDSVRAAAGLPAAAGRTASR